MPYLFFCDAHVRRDVSKDSWLYEKTLISNTFATTQKSGTLWFTNLD